MYLYVLIVEGNITIACVLYRTRKSSEPLKSSRNPSNRRFPTHRHDTRVRLRCSWIVLPPCAQPPPQPPTRLEPRRPPPWPTAH
jgi:hypothetical protein